MSWKSFPALRMKPVWQPPPPVTISWKSVRVTSWKSWAALRMKPKWPPSPVTALWKLNVWLRTYGCNSTRDTMPGALSFVWILIPEKIPCQVSEMIAHLWNLLVGILKVSVLSRCQTVCGLTCFRTMLKRILILKIPFVKRRELSNLRSLGFSSHSFSQDCLLLHTHQMQTVALENWVGGEVALYWLSLAGIGLESCTFLPSTFHEAVVLLFGTRKR